MFAKTEQTLVRKIWNISWPLVLLLVIISGCGIAALYSADGGSFDRWAMPQFKKFCIAITGMLIVSVIDIRVWHRFAYLIYAAGFTMLIIVEIMGHVGMGAQRWINLGFIQLQPSELMKVAVVIALARYFHALEFAETKRLINLIPPALMVAAPVGLVLLQPDLGTSLKIAMVGVAVFFIAGAPLWIFLTGLAATIISAPIGWHFMHDYQKQRVLTFMNPESDPLGSGYHITQSKIALGSGGIEGKGFLQGSQSHLNFLPEKQTDFIFTLWAEEWGFIGGLFILLLFSLAFIYAGFIAFRCRHRFGKLLAFGLMVNFSLYVFINIAMVMGLIPVVGVPLPLVS
jgi:rod shape determining protein RodA